MKRSRLWPLIGVAMTTALSSSAFADGGQCYLHREMPIERQLRRLSIDLLGTVPDVADYDAVAGKAAIPDDLIDGYLADDQFRIQMRHYHEDLLWTNPSTVLGDVGFSLSSAVVSPGVTVFFVPSTGKQRLYRGGDGTHHCQDKPQSALGYDAAGMPIAEPMAPDAVGPVVAEGWEDIHPYWEPDATKTIKVCAFDAQAAKTYTLPPGDPNAGTMTCDHVLASSKSCGCGPSLDYCMIGSVQTAVLTSMREQLLRSVDAATSKAPYSDLLVSKRAYVNGPLVHYFRYLGQRQTFSRTQNLYEPSDGPLPDIPYTETDTWKAVDRLAPHSGVLTLPAYLLRFQTNRARANRYRIAFEGQFFQPPSTKDTACNKDGDDLTQRCVCRSCHVTLEPMAAYFGQLSEAGTTSLQSFTREYPTLTACSRGISPASSAWCDRFYQTVPDLVDPDIRPYKLKAMRYSDKAHPDVQPHFDDGPGGLAATDIASGLFHQVTTRRMFPMLMKREPNLDAASPDYEGDLLDGIAKEFQASEDLKVLVKRLVKLPTYRRMP
jgi:hypothetical protein